MKFIYYVLLIIYLIANGVMAWAIFGSVFSEVPQGGAEMAGTGMAFFILLMFWVMLALIGYMILRLFKPSGN